MPDFHAASPVHLVEISPALEQIQRNALTAGGAGPPGTK